MHPILSIGWSNWQGHLTGFNAPKHEIKPSKRTKLTRVLVQEHPRQRPNSDGDTRVVGGPQVRLIGRGYRLLTLRRWLSLNQWVWEWGSVNLVGVGKHKIALKRVPLKRRAIWDNNFPLPKVPATRPTQLDPIQLIVEKVRQRSHDRSTDRTDRAFEIDAKSKEQASSYQRVGRLSI